jgi:pimeloyl-ACP methyl ester carboxylesterase
MRVFLIHGMGRTSVSLALLAARLRRAGHTTSSYGYLVTRDPLDVIADRFVEHIERSGGVDVDFAVVGHSLGTIITRMALPRLPGLRRLVMLAPPNQPPALARLLAENPVFRALTRDAGRRLADAAGFYPTLPVPQVPTLIVAGTAGPRFARSPWQGGHNDGIVGVDETRLDGPQTAHVTVDAIHTLLMNSAEVTGLVLRFLAGEGEPSSRVRTSASPGG